MSMTKVISLTVLANGRVIDGKSLLFDANLYVSDGEQIVAALQYFNQDNRKFPLVGKYEVVATIAKMPPKIEINDSIVLEDTEYDAIGDIIMLHSVEIDDPKQRPLIEIIGKAENVLKKDAEFDVNAEQYIRLLGGKGILPVHALIPDSAKYKTKRDGSSSKPVPNQNSSLELSGFITRVIPREGDPEERVDRFCVAVEGVTFLGRSSGSNVLPEGSTQVRTQTGKRKKVFNFDTNQPSEIIQSCDDESSKESPNKRQKGSKDSEVTEQVDESSGSNGGRPRRHGSGAKR
ncbi:hypothetical protein K435DRAFT_871979 [Dendrothele bispora CBS 962.96]|uniref:Uncharacterized protein n=1 Tax=Dendrothele bispora (strain CBS 962.96) TaxID=1314807 RepID=A0A4V6T4X8_DENBC|nr:hypothetical protein K435DRAFT_811331 [Dendrothele bispora CBS 962.96]THU82771.1 hypothetical protein K435DRAFT_871975 [Dendrothele bispora CBS 962.96]THU82775.1 hypothetical protein K435DRAFT_871979 [Dendrothele bispora CBS 962.96]